MRFSLCVCWIISHGVQMEKQNWCCKVKTRWKLCFSFPIHLCSCFFKYTYFTSNIFCNQQLHTFSCNMSSIRIKHVIVIFSFQSKFPSQSHCLGQFILFWLLILTLLFFGAFYAVPFSMNSVKRLPGSLDRIILSFRKPFLSFYIYLLLIWLFFFK